MSTRKTSPQQSELAACQAPVTYNAQLEGRVGRLEGAVESLVNEVQETSKSVKLIADNMGGFRETILTELNKAKTPQWPYITAAGGFIFTLFTVLATFLGFVISGTKSSINDTNASVVELREKLNAKAYNDGETAQWHKTVDSSLTKLDNSLQREMQLINDTTTAKVIALDDKLQTEFGGINKRIEDKVAEIKHSIEDLYIWKEGVQSTISGNTEKLKLALERLNVIEQECKSINKTAWTKTDHEYFDGLVQTELKEIRDALHAQCLQSASCPK